MKLFLPFLFLILCSSSSAQQDSLIYSYEAGNTDSVEVINQDTIVPGHVKYFYTNELDTLIEIQKNINIKKGQKTTKGFKVQIYSCSGVNCQQKADKNFNQFLIAYPHIRAEKIWDPPSYKVRVGNCRNRFEAEKIKSEIKEDFPFIFIVPSFIDSPFQIKSEQRTAE